MRARNGKIVAQSEGYQRKGDCLKTISAVKWDASAANVNLVEK